MKITVLICQSLESLFIHLNVYLCLFVNVFIHKAAQFVWACSVLHSFFHHRVAMFEVLISLLREKWDKWRQSQIGNPVPFLQKGCVFKLIDCVFLSSGTKHKCQTFFKCTHLFMKILLICSHVEMRKIVTYDH